MRQAYTEGDGAADDVSGRSIHIDMRGVDDATMMHVNSVPMLKQYFGQFGAIKRATPNLTKKWARIEFVSAQSAQAALAQPMVGSGVWRAYDDVV